MDNSVNIMSSYNNMVVYFIFNNITSINLIKLLTFIGGIFIGEKKDRKFKFAPSKKILVQGLSLCTKIEYL